MRSLHSCWLQKSFNVSSISRHQHLRCRSVRMSSDASSPTSAKATPDILSFLDVPYFEGEGACGDKHCLDVYIAGAPFPRPRSRTCLFIHGGSWQRGDRRHPSIPDELYGNIGRAFAKAGMVGLVMSYRLAPGVQHPEQVKDVARAIRWARGNASRYGGSDEDLVVVGHSAGAHLAALCLSDTRWLEEEGVMTHSGAAAAAAAATANGGGAVNERNAPLPPRCAHPSRVVSGFVGISGVYDLVRMGSNVVGGIIAKTAFGDDRRAWEHASPVHRIRALPAAVSKSKDRGTLHAWCPLLEADVLLLTALSDFHLKDDAEALADALQNARCNQATASSRKADAGIVNADRLGKYGENSDVVHSGTSERGDETERDESEDDSGPRGSVRHVCLEGDDHFSTIFAFGEPGKDASETVLQFVRSIPRASSKPS